MHSKPFEQRKNPMHYPYDERMNAAREALATKDPEILTQFIEDEEELLCQLTPPTHRSGALDFAKASLRALLASITPSTSSSTQPPFFSLGGSFADTVLLNSSSTLFFFPPAGDGVANAEPTVMNGSEESQSTGNSFTDTEYQGLSSGSSDTESQSSRPSL